MLERLLGPPHMVTDLVIPSTPDASAKFHASRALAHRPGARPGAVVCCALQIYRWGRDCRPARDLAVLEETVAGRWKASPFATAWVGPSTWCLRTVSPGQAKGSQSAAPQRAARPCSVARSPTARCTCCTTAAAQAGSSARGSPGRCLKSVASRSPPIVGLQAQSALDEPASVASDLQRVTRACLFMSINHAGKSYKDQTSCPRGSTCIVAGLFLWERLDSIVSLLHACLPYSYVASTFPPPSPTPDALYTVLHTGHVVCSLLLTSGHVQAACMYSSQLAWL